MKNEMSSGQFKQMVGRRLALTEQILNSKGSEYATDANRFHNFDAASDFTGDTPEKVLWGFLMKHIVSVQDIVEHPVVTEERMDEKIGDCICYLILLEGLIRRRNGHQFTYRKIGGKEFKEEMAKACGKTFVPFDTANIPTMEQVENRNEFLKKLRAVFKIAMGIKDVPCPVCKKMAEQWTRRYHKEGFHDIECKSCSYKEPNTTIKLPEWKE